MAIFHFHAAVVSRGAGQSACASAAYCAGESITCNRSGITHDYTRKQGVDYSEIISPKIGNKIYQGSRSDLWNYVESCEKRKDAQLARSITVAIPVELNNPSKIELVREFVTENFVNRGMIADVNIHDINSHNPHAHIMLTMRDLIINSEGEVEFGQKNRSWNDRALVEEQRENWARTANKYLAQVSDARIDHRSLADQGIDRLPQIHVGVAAWAMEKKGIQTERGDIHRQIAAANQAYAAARQESREIDLSLTAEQKASADQKLAQQPPKIRRERQLYDRKLQKFVVVVDEVDDVPTRTRDFKQEIAALKASLLETNQRMEEASQPAQTKLYTQSSATEFTKQPLEIDEEIEPEELVINGVEEKTDNEEKEESNHPIDERSELQQQFDRVSRKVNKKKNVRDMTMEELTCGYAQIDPGYEEFEEEESESQGFGLSM